MSAEQRPEASSIPLSIEELEDLYQNAPCGYLSLKPDGRIDRVNKTFLAWTGHGPEDLPGRRFQDLISIAGKIFYETHFAPLLRLQGFFNEVALDLVAKDGTPIPILVNATERRDADDKPTFIRITVFNATDRRRYERELLAARNALATANQELRAFYDTLPVGIFRADASGRIVQASQRFCALFGVELADEWRAAIAAEDRSEVERHLKESACDGDALSIRFRVADADATFRHVEMKAVPISGAEDDVSVFVGVVEDVTEQVRADALRRQIDRDAAIRQLTGGMAHNLNNILAVLMANLEVLESNLADRPELRRAINGGLVASERAAMLVKRLLVYSGHSTSGFDVVEVDPCLHGIERELAGRFGPSHQLTFELRTPGAFVELDADMLKEAVEELVSNAAAAMPSGGEIRISTELGEEKASGDQRNIVIAVNDSGIGMDAETLAKAREPFFTTREVGQGIGLGLSLVDGITRIAGGALKLRSKVGTGTTAEIHLPLATESR